MPGRRHSALAVGAALIALSAYLGGVGLVSGWLDTRGTIDGRLPLHSPVLGGVALTIGAAFVVIGVRSPRAPNREELTCVS